MNKMNRIIFLLFLLLIIKTINKDIVDFEYTQYKQRAQNHIHDQLNIDFEHIQVKQENLKLPKACNLIEELQDYSTQKQNHLIQTDIDQYLHNMKQKFLDLLKITQTISNSQAKILHFQGLINKTYPIAPNELKIIELEDYEKSLKNLTNFIRSKQKELKQIFQKIKDFNDNTNLIQSQRVELNFNIDLLKQKINYLKDLQEKIRLAQSNLGPQNDYNSYFDQLQRQFNNQTILIANIDSIIRKKDQLTKLKKQKANLQSSITALNLYINDVGLCNQQKQNIRLQFKNHQKINQLISELRQLKRTQQPNIYCEGVVKKLTQKIKTMLRYYDIVASCASDLPQKMHSLRKEKQYLIQIIQKINHLQSVQNFTEFQKSYNSQKDKIQIMYLKIKDWKIKQFNHNPDQIAQIRKNTQNQLQILLLKKKQSQSYQNQPSHSTISMNVLNLINDLRNVKAQYCALYHKYDTLANNLWTQVHQYQSQMSLRNKLLKLEYEERLKYEQLSIQLIQLRALIYQKLNK